MAVTTMVAVERTGPAIRAALAAYAPEDEPRFASELREALVRADEDLDLTAPLAVLRRWHARALMAANPLSPEELAQVERAKAGDCTGFVVRHDDGTTSVI